MMRALSEKAAGTGNPVSAGRQRIMSWVLAAAVVVLLCAPAAHGAEPAGAAPLRIISLAPSVTEILFALGLGEQVVGVTSYCDHPEEARSRPKIGGMSNPSLETVIRLKPDIVVMTTDGNPKEFEERLRSLNIRTFVFTSRRIAELPGGIRELGSALGVSERAGRLASDIGDSLEEYSRSGGSRQGPKKVLYIIWPEPFIVAGPGTAIDDAIALIGHENIAADSPSPYPKYSLEEVIRRSPEVIFIGKSMGDIDMKKVTENLLSRISTVPAVRNGSVYFVSDMLYRLGPRVIPGIEELSGWLR